MRRKGIAASPRGKFSPKGFDHLVKNGAAGGGAIIDRGNERRWLAVHAASDGQRLIHLPAGQGVSGACGDKSFEAAGDFSVTLRQGETRLWLLERS